MNVNDPHFWRKTNKKNEYCQWETFYTTSPTSSNSKEIITFFKIVWGFLVGGRRAGSRYRKARFSLVRTQGQIGKGDMAPSLTPLLHPHDDIHTQPGRRNPPLELEVNSNLQPLLRLCSWWACLEMDCPPQGSLLFSRAFSQENWSSMTPPNGK